jgi:hypothetical protein
VRPLSFAAESAAIGETATSFTRPLAPGNAPRWHRRIKVKGFRQVVDWRVTRYDEPKSIELVGRGRGGIRIGLCLHVEEKGQGPSSSVASGSVFRVVAELGGGLLNTRIGNLVAKVIESDVRTSVRNLAALR